MVLIFHSYSNTEINVRELFWFHLISDNCHSGKNEVIAGIVRIRIAVNPMFETTTVFEIVKMVQSL
ncbi:MAG: hypothetical protein HQ510_10045 [Candidatus Marinimicrobia bacterium]|nr:hypothetical protein [Candidatus Neomarinimicrobiota bacterium]